MTGQKQTYATNTKIITNLEADPKKQEHSILTLKSIRMAHINRKISERMATESRSEFTTSRI